MATSILVIVWRLIFFSYQNEVFKTKILIFGTGDEAKRLAKEILCRKHLGYEIKGFVGNNYLSYGMDIENLHMLGTAEDLQAIVQREGIDKGHHRNFTSYR